MSIYGIISNFYDKSSITNNTLLIIIAYKITEYSLPRLLHTICQSLSQVQSEPIPKPSQLQYRIIPSSKCYVWQYLLSIAEKACN